MNPTSSNIAMVIAERGSDWTRWVDRLRNDETDVCMIMQQDGETVSQLASRVRHRVEELAEGETLSRAVIVGGGRTDADAVSARSLTIRALVAPMVQAGGGEVVLASSYKDRFSMMGLASTVASMLHGTGVQVAPAPLPAVA